MALRYRAVHLGMAPGGSPEGPALWRLVPIARALGTLAYAESDLRYLKRQGIGGWVEDETGQFTPVPGAKTAKLRSVADAAWERARTLRRSR